MDPFKPYVPRPKIAAARPPSRDEAEALALTAVAHIVGDDDLLPRFLALTGCGLDALKERLAEPGFLGAVLDFVLGDEATTITVAQAQGLPPESIGLARAKLP